MKIDRVIAHWVPTNDSSRKLQLSENYPSTFNTSFWVDKIDDSLIKKKCYDIEFIANKQDKIGLLIRQLRGAQKEKFIEYSQELGTYLYEAQSKKSISDGFLIVIKGKNDNDRDYVCLLKLEGIQGSEALFDPKSKSFNLRNIENILLTEKTKVFKMGYFEFDGHNILSKKAMDDQIQKGEIATFWLTNFLKCKMAEDPESNTKKFYNYISEFAIKGRLKPQESINLSLALASEMNSFDKTLNISEFASKHLPSELLEEFNNKATTAKVPMFEFEKKIPTSLKMKIEKRTFFLDGNIIVIAPQIEIYSKTPRIKLEKSGTEKFLSLREKIKSVK
ncbi:nucleoid-associated protein [Leptospira sp. 201903075]|uniref:nucleoid-associated protein n=1 Tax=Leptospira chreensis TaxID=2810035 RepID=UPI001962CBAA|nr:nucleoid-associated protein [Leptospira chreensis]MBM9588815.1 nucleoid-associated protein [Leptospira chreensis]